MSAPAAPVRGRAVLLISRDLLLADPRPFRLPGAAQRELHETDDPAVILRIINALSQTARDELRELAKWVRAYDMEPVPEGERPKKSRVSSQSRRPRP